MNEDQKFRVVCPYCQKKLKKSHPKEDMSGTLVIKCEYCIKRFVFDWEYVFECSTKKIEE